MRTPQTTEYTIWKLMMGRCYNSNRPDYPSYGGRGIKVCSRWHLFESFLLDMGNRPSKLHSLDRKENGGDYEPSNCRWATKIEQQNNTRSNRIIEYRGSPMTIANAVRASGNSITPETARNRISRGWPAELAIDTPNAYRREPGTRRVMK